MSTLGQYDGIFLSLLEGRIFSYEIIEEGQGRRLILTDQNGGRVFYTNQFLNTENVNPSRDLITITGDIIDSVSNYQIIDLQGKILCQDNFTSTISINTLPQGMYFLVLNNNNNKLVKRFIKN